MVGPLTPVTSTHINVSNSNSNTTNRAFKDFADLSGFKNSTVGHLRNLTQNGSELAIPGVTTNAEDVAGAFVFCVFEMGFCLGGWKSEWG